MSQGLQVEEEEEAEGEEEEEEQRAYHSCRLNLIKVLLGDDSVKQFAASA